MNSHPDVNPAAFAFVRAVASGSPMPELAWVLDVGGGAAELRITSSVPIHSARLWSTSSTSRDFRTSRWTDTPMREQAGSTGGGGSVVGGAAVSATGYTAIFGEVELREGGTPFKLTTRVQVVDGGSDASAAR